MIEEEEEEGEEVIRDFDDLIIGIPTDDIIIDIKNEENELHNYNNEIENEGKGNVGFIANYEYIFDSNLDIFPILKNGIGYPVFMFYILPYLSTIDLFNVLSISRHLQEVNFSSSFWKDFIYRDFIYPSLQYTCPTYDPEYEFIRTLNDNDGDTRTNSIEIRKTYNEYKLIYFNRFNEIKERIQNSKISLEEAKRNNRQQSKIKKTEYFLDLTQVRILIPLILSSIFSSIIMFAMYFDGLDINIWVCASPILFSFLYLYFCMLVARIVYINQFYEESIFYEMWEKMRGPIRIIFTEGLGESAILTYLTCLYTFLFLIEIILLTFKFDTNSTVSKNTNWATIFLPIWIAYALYGMLPVMIKLGEGFGGYIGGIILFWLPSLVFFICLTLKLSGIDKSDKKFSMKVIFFPFWLLEGIFMISTLFYLCFGCTNRQIRQDRSRLDENIETFISTWITMSPFVIFQALISARDDNHNSVRTIDSMVPILICVGWLFIASIVSVWRFRSPFDESRAAKKKEEAGKRILYTI